MSATILILDDDEPFRHLVGAMLEQRGHHVVHAGRGKEATAAMQEHAVDLVIVDGVLPDIDGVRWLTRLRASGNHVPAAFMSVLSAFWSDRRSYERLTGELGVQMVLHKPVVPDVFVEQIGGLLERIGGRPEAQSSTEVDAEALLAGLRAEYGKALPARVSQLSDAVRQARSNAEDAMSLASARMEAHKLRGTAGSYGFDAVGLAAGRLEDALTRIESSPRDAPASAWQQIDAMVGELAASLATAEAAPRAAPRVLGSARVLAIADDAELARLEELARPQLVQILRAHTESEAVSVARTATPDAALVDARSVGAGDPYRVVRALREVAGCSSLPIAYVSGDGPVSSRIEAANAGVSMYLSLPLDHDDVADAIRKLVSAGKADRPKVLVVDDDEPFCRRVAAALAEARMEVRTLQQPERILDALDAEPPELVLLDVQMPGISGFDVCRMLRVTPRWQELPVLFVTAKTDAASRVAAFEAGGDDYLAKPVIREELLARVRVRIERARAMRERAERDTVTGMLTRRAFLERLTERLAETKRRGTHLAVAMLDLDEFKHVNDTQGHLAGDRVLAALGRLLALRFRAEDLRGRWGGEEFILALPGETAASARGALDRMREEFAGLSFGEDLAEPWRVTLSAGIASFPEDGTSTEALIGEADRRLYVAKRHGRNLVVSTR